MGLVHIRSHDYGTVRGVNGSLVSTAALSAHGGYTEPYTAPELIRENIRSRVSDVYTLGVLLFQVLTGEWARCWPRRAPCSAAAAGRARVPVARCDHARAALGEEEQGDELAHGQVQPHLSVRGEPAAGGQVASRCGRVCRCSRVSPVTAISSLVDATERAAPLIKLGLGLAASAIASWLARCAWRSRVELIEQVTVCGGSLTTDCNNSHGVAPGAPAHQDCGRERRVRGRAHRDGRRRRPQPGARRPRHGPYQVRPGAASCA